MSKRKYTKEELRIIELYKEVKTLYENSHVYTPKPPIDYEGIEKGDDPPKSYDRIIKIFEGLIEEKRKNITLEKKQKKFKKQLPIAKNPKEIAELTGDLFPNVGFRTADYKGVTEMRGRQEALWKKDKLAALVSIEDLSLLELGRKKVYTDQGYLIPIPPKVTVSQAKNIDTLIYLLENKNRQREAAEIEEAGEMEFYFREYAKIRGHSESELKKGGNFNNELKRDLISGGITSYITETDKTYIIGSFYNIEVPKVKSKEKWKIYFNEPYKSYLLDIGQYYPILPEAIADRKTNANKGYLYFFLKEVLRIRNNPDKNFKAQQKVKTLLDRIKISGYAKKRPAKSFKVLAECICYMAEHYPKHLTQVRLLNDKYETEVFDDLSIFEKADYKKFMAQYLSRIALTDIREALISFNPISEEEGRATEEKQKEFEYLEGHFLPE